MSSAPEVHNSMMPYYPQHYHHGYHHQAYYPQPHLRVQAPQQHHHHHWPYYYPQSQQYYQYQHQHPRYHAQTSYAHHEVIPPAPISPEPEQHGEVVDHEEAPASASPSGPEHALPVLPMNEFAPSQTTAFTPVVHRSTTSKPHSPRSSSSRRSVSFAPTVRVKTVDKLASTPQGKSMLYYTKAEMHGFYLQVKEYHSSCKKAGRLPSCARQCLVRHNPHQQQQDGNAKKHNLASDPALRGLELFFFPLRVRNKQLARKSLLKYYKDLYDPSNVEYPTTSDGERIHALSAASVKLGRWAELVARETGRLDAIRAHPDPYSNDATRSNKASRRQDVEKRLCVCPSSSPICVSKTEEMATVEEEEVDGIIPSIDAVRTVSFDEDSEAEEDGHDEPLSKRRRL